MRTLSILLFSAFVILPDLASAAVKSNNGACGVQPQNRNCKLRGFSAAPVKSAIPFDLGSGENTGATVSPSTRSEMKPARIAR